MRTVKLPEMTAIPIIAMFLEEDSETTWNDIYTYYGHISWSGQQNDLKWKLYLLWPSFLRRTTTQSEKTAIPIKAKFRGEDSETTWNDRYTYYDHVSWGEQRNYLKWQLYLLWPSFLRRTAKLHEMTAIPITAIFLYLVCPHFLRMSAKLPEMTAIPIMAVCLE